MKLRIFVGLVTATLLLLASMGPSFGRSTPYEQTKDDPTVHPWQDDDLWSDQDTPALYVVPVGPIGGTISIPFRWINSFVTKQSAPSPKQEVARTPKPMSLNKKGDMR